MSSVLSVGLLLAGGALFAGPASAHAGLAGWEGQDGGVESYCYDPSVTSGHRAEMYDAIQYLDSASDVNRDSVNCSSTTDIVFVKVNGNYGYRGVSYCNILPPYPGAKCDQYVVILNDYELYGLQNIQKTACHELGHVVSLDHFAMSGRPFDSCLVSGEVPDGSAWISYASHEISSHINPNF